MANNIVRIGSRFMDKDSGEKFIVTDITINTISHRVLVYYEDSQRNEDYISLEELCRLVKSGDIKVL